jgi:hypothetical protein
MYRNIMVPLDGSTVGEHALPHALRIARRGGATLHLVHVHFNPNQVWGVKQRHHITGAINGYAVRGSLGSAWRPVFSAARRGLAARQRGGGWRGRPMPGGPSAH